MDRSAAISERTKKSRNVGMQWILHRCKMETKRFDSINKFYLITIIGGRTVVTAAHCVDAASKRDLGEM